MNLGLRPTAVVFIIALVAARADEGDVSPAQPVIPKRTFSVMDFGAVPDGRTPNTDAFRRAIGAVRAAGGGTLAVPAGDYLTGPINLCSHLELCLNAGARLIFLQDFSVYRIEATKYRPLVGAKDCEDIVVSGAGALDGQGDPWWVIERKVKAEARARGLQDAEIGRPRMMVFENCRRVRVQGITLTNSPMYHLVPTRCEDVTIDRVRILAPPDSPNTDGIDPVVSRRVLITHCLIDTGDDCIAVKAGVKGFGPSEEILVTDCTFLHGHGCSIGSDTDSGVRNMTVRRCTFDGTDAGVRLKSRRGRGGLVENITYMDLKMTHVGQAIVITSYYYGLPRQGQHDAAVPVTPDTPVWHHIVVRNVIATGGSRDAGLVIGLPEMPARDIVLENISIESRYGLRVAYTDGMTWSNVAVTAQVGPSFIVEDTVHGLTR